MSDTPPPGNCQATMPGNLRCGLPAGHRGEHIFYEAAPPFWPEMLPAIIHPSMVAEYRAVMALVRGRALWRRRDAGEIAGVVECAVFEAPRVNPWDVVERITVREVIMVGPVNDMRASARWEYDSLAAFEKEWVRR